MVFIPLSWTYLYQKMFYCRKTWKFFHEKIYIFGVFFGKFWFFKRFLKKVLGFSEQLCVFFFRGVSGAIVVLHSSLSLFVASTRLIRSGVGAIDSVDQSHQFFDQYDTSEVSEKIFLGDFLMACISNFAYKLYQRKLKTITRKKYALHFLIQPLHLSFESTDLQRKN